MPGPVPNRSEDLARDRSRKGGAHLHQEITKGKAYPVAHVDPDPEWGKIARMLWDSLALSGQSAFYQQSDWAYAYHVCDELDAYKRPVTDRNGNEYRKLSGQMFMALNAAMEKLLLTEGDRRRVRIELEEPDDGEASEGEKAVEDYKAMLAEGPQLSLVPPLPDEQTA